MVRIMLGYAILMAFAFLCCGWDCNSSSPSWGDFPTTFVAPCWGCLIMWECGTPVLGKRKDFYHLYVSSISKYLPEKKNNLSCLFSAFVRKDSSGFFLKILSGRLYLPTHTLYLFFNKHISPCSSIHTNSHQYLRDNIAAAAGLSWLLTSKHLQLPDKSLSGAID